MRSSRHPFPVWFMINEKQLENSEYFKYLCGALSNGARCTREIKSFITIKKRHSTRRKVLSPVIWIQTFVKKVVKRNVWRIDFCGADTWALRTADQKFLGSFEIWYWRGMEKISWTDHVKN
jgi:hypothetical protein